MSSIRHIFAPDGPIAQAIPGYHLREQQVELAEQIASCISKQGAFIAEAGTGTGKTFAYLIPAIQSGGKVIVSTGTKTLQDQIFNKDIPTVRKILKTPLKVALLKGRANYVCHYYLSNALDDGRFLSREDAHHARLIQRFTQETKTGDKSDCFAVPETSPVWQQVTSSRENCLGQDCPAHDDCFVLAARREAMAADLVVVNHHLFFADVMLRDEGVAELLPACNTVIFDEAHQLPEVAALFFGTNFSTGQLNELIRDTRNEGLLVARDCLDLQDSGKRLDKLAKDLRLVVGVDNGRFAFPQLQQKRGFSEALDELIAELAVFTQCLSTQAQRSPGLQKCWERACELQERVTAWQTPPTAGTVRWGEAFNLSLQLNTTPLDVAPVFQKQMAGIPRSWIFTSATLAVQGKFEHYQAELGLWEAETGCWHSPFDYSQQALLYVPTGLPNPNAFDYSDAVVAAALAPLLACQGGAFFLCTSLRAMRRIHELLLARLADHGQSDRPLLLQGSASKNELLERFRRAGNAILVGSQSFWEGVDVRGEALSLVVIDKIPFSPPDDPVLAARIEALEQQGRNPFMEYQVPHAVINVKQGAGRLIRDEQDRGVLMICDPRLIDKPYGKRIWRSLPPMRRTRVESEVVAFFASPKV